MRVFRRLVPRGSWPRPGPTCALALLALHLGGPAQAEGILVFGDSISVGSDDEPVPDDRCPPGGGSPSSAGWAPIVECRLRARGDTRAWARYAQGAATSWWGVARLDAALAAAPEATTALLSFHVNDCAIGGCGAVCAGGSRSGLACATDPDCPSASCDYSQAHRCSSAETRANLRTIIDALLAAGFERVLYWKSPGRIGTLETGNPCGVEQFDGSADAVDPLFLSDPRPIGYADEPRVEYLAATFRDFCPGSGLQGCGPADAEGDRRRWWFAHDAVDGAGSMRHIHPNAWGYMEIAARVGERLAGERLGTRPPRPLVVVSERGETSLSIRVLQAADADGDPLAVYAWAACADTRGTSADPACDRPKDPSDLRPLLPRECGARTGSDHDGLGATSQNPAFPLRHVVRVSDGRADLVGLAPDTDYRICAVAWDGFQGSLMNDAIVTSTLEPDADGDGVPDARDVCRADPDPGQLDADLDGYGNACDADYDGDGIVGTSDWIAQRLAFGATGSDPRYELRLDAEGDGVIGASDLALVARRFGGPPGPSGLACAGTPPCAAPTP